MQDKSITKELADIVEELKNPNLEFEFKEGNIKTIEWFKYNL